ncbi:response regulator [Variovorax sp. RHLX14]|uniref:response regulator n=1 Tax=Variovorax sp. RHLX14 TaxID=1259731 RepID=UPI003F488BEB
MSMLSHNLEIFIVEDDKIVASYITEILNSCTGIQVVKCVHTEDAALNWLSDNRATWHLAIIDLALGAGSGARVLSAHRVRKPEQKMVVLSSYLDNEMRRRCMGLGADAVFQKSSDMQSLIDYCSAIYSSKNSAFS